MTTGIQTERERERDMSRGTTVGKTGGFKRRSATQYPAVAGTFAARDFWRERERRTVTKPRTWKKGKKLLERKEEEGEHSMVKPECNHVDECNENS